MIEIKHEGHYANCVGHSVSRDVWYLVYKGWKIGMVFSLEAAQEMRKHWHLPTLEPRWREHQGSRLVIQKKGLGNDAILMAFMDAGFSEQEAQQAIDNDIGDK